MSFQKMNICRSVQVAFNLFQMFANNTINHVCDEETGEFTQYQGQPNSFTREVGIPPFNNDDLKLISSMLQGDYSDVRIHDIQRSGPRHEGSESRLVQFIVKTRHFGKVIFSAIVNREYLSGEEVLGWSRWQMYRVTVVSQKGDRFYLSTTYSERKDAEDNFSLPMKENVGSLVIFLKF